MNRHLGCAALRRVPLLSFAVAGLTLSAVNAQQPGAPADQQIEVTSATFVQNGPLPDSMIYNYPVNGLNICTANGAPGGDQSPQLSWRHVPPGTRSFVVVLYDPTASFTHWGMYNIPARTRNLPEDAGAPDSSYGSQISNDFGDSNYDGPCPPQGVAPEAHHYVFTVYALDTELTLISSANFPAGAEQLYHALIDAGRDGHILASGNLSTLYSATPPSN